MPTDYPDFPHHTQIARYFDSYVDHFGFRDKIRFETGVEHAERGDDGVWTVTLDDGETKRYDMLLVANGHHWNPRWPEPAFPGRFDGNQMHSHHYIENSEIRDKNVLVVGIGNSAMDIAVESSFVANRTFISSRRGAYILPKYLFGRPLDQIGVNALTPMLPFAFRRAILMALYRVGVGKVQDYGLPEPDHKIGEAHPDDLGRLPQPDRPRRHDLEAQRLRAPGRQREVRGRQRRADRHDRVVHRLQGHLPVLRSGLHLGP